MVFFVFGFAFILRLTFLENELRYVAWRRNKNSQVNCCSLIFVLSLLSGFLLEVYLKLSFNLQALDTFNTAVVSPIYYVMFTSLTIFASVIMFKVNAEFIYF